MNIYMLIIISFLITIYLIDTIADRLNVKTFPVIFLLNLKDIMTGKNMLNHRNI